MHIARSLLASAIVLVLAAGPAAANSGGGSMGGGFRGGGGWGGSRGGLGAMGIGIGAMLGGIASQPAAPAGPGYYPPMQQYQPPPQYDPSQAYQPPAYQPQYYPPTQQYQPPPQQYSDPAPQYAPPDDAPPPVRRAAPPPRAPAAVDPAPQVMPASADGTLDATVNAEPPPAALTGPLLQEINGKNASNRTDMGATDSPTLRQINDQLKSDLDASAPVITEPTPDTPDVAAALATEDVKHAADVLRKWSLPPPAPPKNKLEKRMKEIDGVVNDFILTK